MVMYRGIEGYMVMYSVYGDVWWCMVMYRWCMVMYGGVWCCIGVYGVL